MSGLGDLLRTPTVADPVSHTRPAIVEDSQHPHHPHGNAASRQAFTAPEPDAIIEQQHGGPGAPRAVPVIATGTVATRPQPAQRWAVGSAAVPDFVATGANARPQIQLLGRDVFRRGAVITNTGANTIFIAPTQQEATPGNGFPIVSGGSYRHDCSGAVWATSAPGGSSAAFAITGDPADQ